jgi:hypothetical protein
MSHNPILADKRLRRWVDHVRRRRPRCERVGPIKQPPPPTYEVELDAPLSGLPLKRTPVMVQVVRTRTPRKPPQRLLGAFPPPRDRAAEEAEARRLLHDLEHNPLSPEEVEPRPNDGYVPTGDLVATRVIDVIHFIEAGEVPKPMLIKLARVILSEMRKYAGE